MKRIGWFIPVWLCVKLACCQELPERAIDAQHIADELVPFPDDDVNYEDLYDNLTQTLSSPLDLNTVTSEELKHLHIITDKQVENILSYRKDQGFFLDIHELQVIQGMDSLSISMILPYIRLIDPASRLNKSFLKRMTSAGNSYIVTRYERRLEGNESAFNGSPDKLYFRLRSAVPGDFSFGITGEKDAGEQLKFDVGNHQLGFDFTSFHLQVKNKGRLRNLIAGDFQTQFGQGLVLGGAFGLGKGGESVSTIRKSNVGFQPYTSIHESAYQRGVALSMDVFPGIDLSVFYSSARRDASFSNQNDTLTVTSFQTTGYHRTESELSRRKKTQEQNAGLVVRFQKKALDGGMVVNYLHYDTPIKRTPTLYNQFAFEGNTNLSTSIFFNYRMDNISCFSEVARSQSGGVGLLCGLLFSLHTRLEAAVVFRNYARNFHSLYGNAFSESTQPQNERGVYWGWKYRWNRQYSLNGYVDIFAFPWLSFRRYAPAEGYEWLLRGSYQPSKQVSVTVHFREESKQRNLPESSNVYKTGDIVRQNFSLHMDYGSGDNIKLKSRIQYSTQQFNGVFSEGLAFVQDVTLSVRDFRFSGRHALFDTGYDTRQYVYETDAWSSYSLPAYSGVGVRNYVLIEYNLSKQVKVWVRYSRTRLANSGEIASAQDAKDGNTRNDIKFQVRFSF